MWEGKTRKGTTFSRAAKPKPPWKSGRFSAPRKSHPKLTFVIPNGAKGPVRNLLSTFAATAPPVWNGHSLRQAQGRLCPLPLTLISIALHKKRVPHLSRFLRKVGTTESPQRRLEVDVALILKTRIRVCLQAYRKPTPSGKRPALQRRVKTHKLNLCHSERAKGPVRNLAVDLRPSPLPVWSGHSCPLLLTLPLTLFDVAGNADTTG